MYNDLDLTDDKPATFYSHTFYDWRINFLRDVVKSWRRPLNNFKFQWYRPIDNPRI